MKLHCFETKIIQTLDDPPTENESDLRLQISFYNVFPKDYDEWDSRPDGDIDVVKIMDMMTQQVKYWDELTFISQLDIRVKCLNYLRANHLLQYPNLVLFQSFPYRMPSFSVDKSNTAQVIPFPQN